jgi:hypothetical protein
MRQRNPNDPSTLLDIASSYPAPSPSSDLVSVNISVSTGFPFVYFFCLDYLLATVFW